MPGTKEGSNRALETIYERHGANFFNRIGKQGGAVKNTRKGFGTRRDNAVTGGRKGGLERARRRRMEKAVTQMEVV